MTIELARSETLRFTRDFAAESFEAQRVIAGSILRARPDHNSQVLATMVERNNPQFQDFVVLDNR